MKHLVIRTKDGIGHRFTVYLGGNDVLDLESLNIHINSDTPEVEIKYKQNAEKKSEFKELEVIGDIVIHGPMKLKIKE